MKLLMLCFKDSVFFKANESFPYTMTVAHESRNIICL